MGDWNEAKQVTRDCQGPETGMRSNRCPETGWETGLRTKQVTRDWQGRLAGRLD